VNVDWTASLYYSCAKQLFYCLNIYLLNTLVFPRTISIRIRQLVHASRCCCCYVLLIVLKSLQSDAPWWTPWSTEYVPCGDVESGTEAGERLTKLSTHRAVDEEVEGTAEESHHVDTQLGHLTLLEVHNGHVECVLNQHCYDQHSKRDFNQQKYCHLYQQISFRIKKER